ncbi:hypothetical protein [Phreatobacter oligotrophus]|uniref:Uncharacterized protein n=1 Tax=Phreatobacter oligotrophus TaxID=1122261 RepID=A0A2T4Z0V8_9HYPH|nr:hypothetical protein [Phreatobacter oligotrophus]PTM53388.1 hypothetical protein C8P69_10641 [Phreatobacter oligotrophus]
MTGPLAAADRFAAAATPARLALSLLGVLLAYGLVTLVHAPIEAVIREGTCAGLDCLRPLRPDTRHGGYGAADFRLYLDAIWGLRDRALFGVLADLPLIAAVTAALLIAAGLARRDIPLGERTATLLVGIPLVYAGADLLENLALAIAYAGLADMAPVLPWLTAMKFGTAVASGAVSAIIGLLRLAA